MTTVYCPNKDCINNKDDGSCVRSTIVLDRPKSSVLHHDIECRFYEKNTAKEAEDMIEELRRGK